MFTDARWERVRKRNYTFSMKEIQLLTCHTCELHEYWIIHIEREFVRWNYLHKSMCAGIISKDYGPLCRDVVLFVCSYHRLRWAITVTLFDEKCKQIVGHLIHLTLSIVKINCGGPSFVLRVARNTMWDTNKTLLSVARVHIWSLGILFLFIAPIRRRTSFYGTAYC